MAVIGSRSFPEARFWENKTPLASLDLGILLSAPSLIGDQVPVRQLEGRISQSGMAETRLRREAVAQEPRSD